MSVSPLWPQLAHWLKPFAGIVDVGVHLTLTTLKPLSSPKRLAPHGVLPELGRLIRDAYLGQLDLQEIRDELTCQFDAFEQAWGAPPDFVDGHHHAHVLPGVRDIVLELAASRLPNGYVRQCCDPAWWILRRGVAVPRAFTIAGLSLPLKKLLDRRRTNDSFRGVTSFKAHATYGDQFRRFLKGPGDRPLIMCHPGKLDDLLPKLDSVLDQREIEFNYFISPEFLDHLDEAGYHLSRMM